MILLFERTQKVGDYLELDSGVRGVVREINVRSVFGEKDESGKAYLRAQLASGGMQI